MEDKNTAIDLQLQKHLPWHKARIKFLEMLILSIIRTRTVAYSHNAVVLNDAEVCSNLRRIQRFFSHYIIDFDIMDERVLSCSAKESS